MNGGFRPICDRCTIASRRSFAIITVVLISLVGCHRLASSESASELPAQTRTSSAVRAERRLYDGAPPVIPHPPLNITCAECHTDTGKPSPPLGIAPANPHASTKGLSGLSNCQQCHVFIREQSTFQNGANEYVGLPQIFTRADRLYDGAPPVIPHRVFMRENCASCHGGPSARTEIQCSHTDRANCRQCHVPVVEKDFVRLTSVSHIDE
jgi:nitrate reductase cytochrome c-type subunit